MADTQGVSRIDALKWKGELLKENFVILTLGRRCGEFWHKSHFHFPSVVVVLEFSATAFEVLASQYGVIPDDVFVFLNARRENAFRPNATKADAANSAAPPSQKKRPRPRPAPRPAPRPRPARPRGGLSLARRPKGAERTEVVVGTALPLRYEQSDLVARLGIAVKKKRKKPRSKKHLNEIYIYTLK